MSSQVNYISETELANVPIGIDAYSSKLNRTREDHNQIRHLYADQSLGLWETGLPTSAGQVRKFPRLEDYLLGTSRNPSAEILETINPRILYLSEIALEEEEQELLSNDSYLGLVNFLNRIYDLNLIPVLGLTYEGNIRAHWRSSPDERLALEFLDSFDLKFVFFYPDSYDPTKVLRISGSGSVLSFLEDYPRAWEFLRRLSD